jgi:hypothetical protein
VSVVNEIWHRKLGAVGKLFVGRKSRSDPLAKLNLRLTFIPIKASGGKRRTDLCDRLPTQAVTG